MKRIFLFIGAALFAHAANAQTVDVKLGAEVFLPSRFTNAVYGPKAGVTFHQPVLGRLGISIGADYVYTRRQPEAVKFMCCHGGCRTVYKTEIERHGLQFPVSVAFDAFRNKSRRLFVTALVGLNPGGDLMHKTVTYTDTGVDRLDNGALRGGALNVRVPMHAGFEVRRLFACKGSVALGTAVALPTGGLKYAYSGPPLRTGSIYLKTGFNLKKQR